MRMVNFGAGEVIDRLTILSSKILYAAEQGREVKHFTDERNVLLTQLRGRELNGTWFPLALDLAAVNAALWRLEDDLRAHRQGSGGRGSAESIAQIAFRIQALNDERAELIDAINHQTGEFLGPEKVR